MKFGSIFKSKYALIDGLGFLIWHHTFKMAAVMSFDKKYICSSVRPPLAASLIVPGP